MTKALTLGIAMLACWGAGGCTTRAAYNAVRTNQRNYCERLPETEHRQCLERTQDDFDEFERKKAEAK